MLGTDGIATVSLNPAIDQTVAIPSFTAGSVNRVAHEQSHAGGKAVNVASFLADTGHRVAVTGFFGEANAAPFERLFADKGIADRFVRLNGSTRVNIKIVDEVRAQVTDINFPGLSGSLADLALLTDVVETMCSHHDWFVLSGSVPAGLPDWVYADLAGRLKAHGRTVVLDASGAPFAAAIAARPDIIKPNIHELEELVGRPLEDRAAVVDAARTMGAKDPLRVFRPAWPGPRSPAPCRCCSAAACAPRTAACSCWPSPTRSATCCCTPWPSSPAPWSRRRWSWRSSGP